MVLGNGALWMSGFLCALIVMSLRWPNKIAIAILIIGAFLFLYLAATVMFSLRFPYMYVSIYVIFFLAIMFTYAGLMGVVRYKSKQRGNSNRTVS